MPDGATESQRSVGSAAEPCPLQQSSILVQVQRQDSREFLGGVKVKLDGPTPGTGTTAAGTGIKLFDSVKPGTYRGELTLDSRQAEVLEKPRLAPFQVARGEDKVVVVEVKSLNHWIEIVLKDELGRPAAGERYRIVLPDQTVREDRLDGNGKARLQRLEAGVCKVTFPDLDPDAWEKT